jgi:hypothetical protein
MTVMTMPDGHSRGRRVRRARTAEAKAKLLVSLEDAERIAASEAVKHPGGALALLGAWADLDDSAIDEMVEDIYAARARDTGRPVQLWTFSILMRRAPSQALVRRLAATYPNKHFTPTASVEKLSQFVPADACDPEDAEQGPHLELTIVDRNVTARSSSSCMRM